MNKYIFILGRHPKLSIAELESLIDFKIIKQLKSILIIEAEEFEPQELLDQLGGTIKIAEYIEEIDHLNQLDLDKIVIKGEDKVRFGFSVYGRKKFPKELKKIGIKYKKELKFQGHKVRYVESKETTLSSVIVRKEKCQDVILVFEGEKVNLGRVLAVQDFESYSERDYGRPARDSLSGMLPPKLAQVMVNLGKAEKDDIIIDPFCGSGTVLQEAWLKGYKNVIGSDISDKAIADSIRNLKWFDEKHTIEIFQADAKEISQHVSKVDRVIAEVYLGPVKNEVKIDKAKKELQKLYKEIFKEIKKILNPGARLVIAFPAWKIPAVAEAVAGKGNKVTYLDMRNILEDLGYKVEGETYLYGRPDAQILREIYIMSHES